MINVADVDEEIQESRSSPIKERYMSNMKEESSFLPEETKPVVVEKKAIVKKVRFSDEVLESESEFNDDNSDSEEEANTKIRSKILGKRLFNDENSNS